MSSSSIASPIQCGAVEFVTAMVPSYTMHLTFGSLFSGWVSAPFLLVGAMVSIWRTTNDFDPTSMILDSQPDPLLLFTHRCGFIMIRYLMDHFSSTHVYCLHPTQSIYYRIRRVRGLSEPTFLFVCLHVLNELLRKSSRKLHQKH